mmetsp:Transcript_44342/g.125571  ORF Transcript_44342/g.125571 Transcript_44342/m.125571 type:complete len:304 (+) Transcript_44342:690-1601(+)
MPAASRPSAWLQPLLIIAAYSFLKCCSYVGENAARILTPSVMASRASRMHHIRSQRSAPVVCTASILPGPGSAFRAADEITSEKGRSSLCSRIVGPWSSSGWYSPKPQNQTAVSSGMPSLRKWRLTACWHSSMSSSHAWESITCASAWVSLFIRTATLQPVPLVQGLMKRSFMSLRSMCPPCCFFFFKSRHAGEALQKSMNWFHCRRDSAHLVGHERWTSRISGVTSSMLARKGGRPSTGMRRFRSRRPIFLRLTEPSSLKTTCTAPATSPSTSASSHTPLRQTWARQPPIRVAALSRDIPPT